MKTLFHIMLTAVLCLTAAPHADAQAKKLNVVTTLNYLRAITEEIGGEHTNVVALANPRQDPHYVTPTPRMNQVARDADLFIDNGLSLDLWSQNVIAASGNPAIQVGSPGHLTATINAPVKELPTEVSRSWGDIHPQGNPHIWLDPFNVKIIAGNIAEKLKQLDPNDGAYYAARLEELKNRIDREMFGEELLKAVGKSAGEILARKAKNNELLPWLQSKHLDGKLGGWMKKAAQIKGMKVITYHKTYIYFADRFGLELAGELEEKPGIPPPPQHRDEVVELIKRDQIKVILNDNFYSREAADYIASKTGANVVLTYIDVGSSDDVRTYEQLITKLLDEIINAAK
jgi:zinc/manganese transport system substrate-binding protein